jgi:hypothetical protein
MRRRHGTHARRGLPALVAALCALALLALPSLAAAKDRNHDRIPDRWEKRHGLSLKVNQAKRDQDRDHLANRGEFKAGMDPRDRDSDNDGVEDGDENAGTIASFDADSGKLVIDLFGGDSISGFITDDTRIECENEQGDDNGATASHDGNSGPGSDSSGPGRDGSDDPAGHDAGDDQGEPGDDPAGHDAGEDQGRHDGDDHVDCTSAALVQGGVVDEAELELRDGRAVYEEIELDGDRAAAP